MSWPTRFLAVPTGWLQQDEQVLSSPKATPEQLREYMAQIPIVYGGLSKGLGAEDFRQMRTSPYASTRATGDAYHYLFSPSGIDYRLEAEVERGRGLVVTRGRHRIEAACELGLPYVPVHVRAVDVAALDAATRSCEAELEPALPDVVRAQRHLDNDHQAAREASRERSQGATATVSREPAGRASRATDSAGVRSPSVPSRDRGPS